MLKKRHFIYAIINQIIFLFTYIITIYFARNLSVEEFGDFSYLKNILALGLFIIWFGLDRSSLHFITKKNFDKIYINNAIKLSLYILLVFVIFSLKIILIIHVEYDYIFLIFLILFISIFDIRYLFDIYQKIEKEILLSFVKIVPLILFIIISFIFNIKINVIDYFIYYCFGYFLYILLQYNFFKLKPLFNFDLHQIKEIKNISQFVFIGGVFSYLNNYIDSFQIMYYLGSYEVGIYSTAYIIFFGLINLTSIFVRYFISKSLIREITREDINVYTKNMLFFSIILSIMVYLSSDLIIIILGEKYIESLEIIYILLIAFLFIAISSIYGNLLISKGLNREYMYAMGIALAVNFILNYTFIPVYGVKVASITTVISAVITTIITWFYFKTKILDKKEGS